MASGVPLGGLGCGVLQVFSDGTRGVFTGLNNWEQPLTQVHFFRPGTASDFRVANPFGLYVEWEGRRTAKLLQRPMLADLPRAASLMLEADFPFARLLVRDPDLPVEAELTHWSPFVPGHPNDSALPLVITECTVRNPHPTPVTVSWLACCLNPVGEWNVGRYNRLRRERGLIGIVCRKRHAAAWDRRAGEVALSTDAEQAEISYWASWMYAKTAFRGDSEDRIIAAWAPFARDGRLPNRATGPEAMGELDEPMGALAVRCSLPPGASRTIRFFYSWFMPNHPDGHRYARRFGSAWDVAAHASRRCRPLREATQAWHQPIRESGVPEWLQDALINSVCVYPAASVWTKDGRFALYENPVKWPLMDSLDVRYYGTMPLALWFPELEHSTLLQFAKAQRPDGRIPHDLGRAQLDCPSDGTTAGVPWKDLATKFALMAYRDALWSHDRRFLKRIYPHVKRAMLWEFGTDGNGDGLPDNEGLDSTYDLWAFYGTSAYTADIFLAALKATERLARLAGDAPMQRRCRQLFRQGSASFERKLWTGRYYRAADQDDGSRDEACIAGQLNGQWYAHLLGLGPLHPRERVRKAVQSMLVLNGRASAFGAVNAVLPDGTVDRHSFHAKNIWVGETYALAALAVYEGFVRDGLALAERMWQTFARHTKSVWSQPDVVIAENGRLGDGEFYVRNVAVWTVAHALARWDRNASRMLTRLAPQLPLPPVRRRSRMEVVAS